MATTTRSSSERTRVATRASDERCASSSHSSTPGRARKLGEGRAAGPLPVGTPSFSASTLSRRAPVSSLWTSASGEEGGGAADTPHTSVHARETACVAGPAVSHVRTNQGRWQGSVRQRVAAPCASPNVPSASEHASGVSSTPCSTRLAPRNWHWVTNSRSEWRSGGPSECPGAGSGRRKMKRPDASKLWIWYDLGAVESFFGGETCNRIGGTLAPSPYKTTRGVLAFPGRHPLPSTSSGTAPLANDVSALLVVHHTSKTSR
mmetsp:Transcript_8032/g.18479  ORF Transcript_8032/g.18479 Transcript_8032/m.18479 type:complete len:262 (-) Transcript_8032:1250-2035(-)